MRWILRAFLFLACIALAVLAALPYFPNLEREAAQFYQAWQTIREGRPAEAAPEDHATPSIEQEVERGRNLITPHPIVSESTETGPSSDSFILEARRRAKEDPAAAMDWLQSQHSGSERLRGMLEVVALWAAEDSESALLWLESKAQGLARLETMTSGVELWAQRKPIEAANWIDGMANDGSKVTAAKALASKWVQSEPEAAAKWVSGLPAGSIRDQAKSALAASWAEVDPEAASIWAFEQSEFIGGSELLLTTLETYTEQAPDEAAAFIRDLSQATEGSELLVKRHIMTRAAQDPAETAAWLSTLATTDPLYSPEYANSLMQKWAETDSIAASAWLSEQAPGDQRDAAISGFSETILQFEPQAAVTWANTISDPNQRISQLTHHVRTWSADDPTAALEWLQTAELEPSLRQKLASELAAD